MLGGGFVNREIFPTLFCTFPGHRPVLECPEGVCPNPLFVVRNRVFDKRLLLFAVLVIYSVGAYATFFYLCFFVKTTPWLSHHSPEFSGVNRGFMGLSGLSVAAFSSTIGIGPLSVKRANRLAAILIRFRETAL
jgi:hypothetical protein